MGELILIEGECGALVIDWKNRSVAWHGLNGSGVVMAPADVVALAARYAGNPDIEVQLLTVFDVDGDFQVCSDATIGDFVHTRCVADEESK